MSAKTIAIANQKGGVGKTVTAVNFAVSLSMEGKKVLIVDFDPQGHSSIYLDYNTYANEGITISNLIDIILQNNFSDTQYTEQDIYQIMHQAVIHSDKGNIDLIPSNFLLAGASISLLNQNHILKTVLSYFKNEYEYILIDCSPTLGVMLINALVAANEVIIPIQPEEFSLDGIVQIIHTIQNIRGSENPYLQISGFLITMAQKRVKEYKEVKEVMFHQFGNLVFQTTISRTVQISRSTKEHIPIVFKKNSEAGKQYRDFAKEYLNRQEV